MRALLAATDPAVRDTMRDALASAGHDVAVVDDVEAMLAAIARDAPDVVVVDAVRDADAPELCRRIRARPDEITFVLALVREGDAASLAERLGALTEAGADDYLLVAPDVPALAARAAARVRIAARRVDECSARRRAEGSLARTQRLLGIDDASAGLQHEINNPLAALLAHATLLEQGLYEPGEVKELAGVVVEQAHRIAEVVRRIAALRYPDGAEFVPDDAADDTAHD
jgi:DNA-binding response OmpR family regulator